MQIKISEPFIGKEEADAVKNVLASGTLVRGSEIKKFEENFARYTGVKYGIATSNGTTALHSALLAHGIGKDDEVIVPTFSFVASANSVIYTGAKPVFADVDEKSFNVTPEEIEGKITKNTKAVMVVHLYGQPCDMDRIKKICDSYGLVLIEDACQAHGAEFRGKKVGSFGTGCFSFYATKNMTTGEGGMITTDDEKIAEKARIIISHGSSKNYDNRTLGYNFRMTEMQAAIGSVQLGKLDEMNKARINNASLYSRLLKHKNDVELPAVLPNRTHVFHQYTIKVHNRDKATKILGKNDIGYGVYYPKPIHCQEFYLNLGYRSTLPVSERLSENVLSLPVHPKLSAKDIEKITECVVQ
ncbi:MAG TPA: DegT/DnrJ/EryC1/StrS family aminotransferase [archaeon]|nr:DegT/DnrJ/EryC1/StrS family aminotransferase [archaeon]